MLKARIIHGWKIIPRSSKGGRIESPDGWKSQDYVVYGPMQIGYDRPEDLPSYVMRAVAMMSKEASRMGDDEPLPEAPKGKKAKGRKVQDIRPCAYPSRKTVPEMIVDNPTKAAQAFWALTEDQRKRNPFYEVAMFLFTNARNELVGYRTFEGTIDHAAIHVREIIFAALQVGALRVLMVHNHPSGRVDTSPQDANAMHTIQKAVDSIELVFTDSIIVARGLNGNPIHASMRENGLMRSSS